MSGVSDREILLRRSTSSQYWIANRLSGTSQRYRSHDARRPAGPETARNCPKTDSIFPAPPVSAGLTTGETQVNRVGDGTESAEARPCSLASLSTAADVRFSVCGADRNARSGSLMRRTTQSVRPAVSITEPLIPTITAAVCAFLWARADYAARQGPPHLSEPIAGSAPRRGTAMQPSRRPGRPGRPWQASGHHVPGAGRAVTACDQALSGQACQAAPRPAPGRRGCRLPGTPGAYWGTAKISPKGALSRPGRHRGPRPSAPPRVRSPEGLSVL
jgi:hypothetical protein